MKRILFCLLAILMASGFVSAQLDNYASFPQNTGAPIRADIVVTSLTNGLQNDIIVSPDNRQIFVFNPDGTLKWKRLAGYELRFDYGRTPVVVDIIGDNNKEIIMYGNPARQGSGATAYIGSSASLYIWDHKGNQLNIISVGKNMILTPPMVADIGEKIILVGASAGNPDPGTPARGFYAFDSSGNKLWQYPDIGPALRTAYNTVGDIDGDNKDEAAVIVKVDDNAFKLVILNLEKTGASVLWEKNIGSLIGGVAIEDIDNDGNNDVIIGSGKGVYVWDKDGNLIWSNSDPVVTNSPPAIGDINGDGIKDVVIGSDHQKKVYAISQGNMLPGFPVITRQSVWTRPALFDLNGDGKLEIIAGDFSGILYGWNHKGAILKGFYQFKPSTKGFMSSPVVADLEGNGKFQIIMGSDDGNVYVWQANVPVAPVAVISFPSEGSIYQLNSPVDFISSSTDEDGTIDSYTWESDKDGIIGNTPSFSTTLSAGWHDITLTVTDNDGLSNTATTRIKINKPPVAKIHTPTNDRTFSQTDSVTFTGTGTDEDGNIILYQWTSDIDGIIQNVGVFTTSSLSVGYHIIPFTVTDNDGASDIKLIQINQTGYDVNWNLKKKPVKGKLTMLAGMGENVYKTGSMVPIKFKISEDGEIIVDKTVEVSVYDPNDKKVFNAIYGNGSKSVRINEDDGQYITNFKSRRNDPAGTYRLEVTFESQRPNQSFSKQITLIGQDTYFVNRFVTLKPVTMGQKLTYEWKLDDTVIGTERELSWIPDEAGIYNIQLTVTKNKKTITEDYTIVVNGEADSNGDDVINVLDMSLLGLNWGKSSQNTDFDDSADVNGDGVIDILDAVKIGKKWS